MWTLDALCSQLNKQAAAQSQRAAPSMAPFVQFSNEKTSLLIRTAGRRTSLDEVLQGWITDQRAQGTERKLNYDAFLFCFFFTTWTMELLK